MMLSLLKLCNIGDRIINECGALGGPRLPWETEVLGENPPPEQINQRQIAYDLTWQEDRRVILF
jgi:hypothetical protein